jgi:hypothetical protein
VDQQRRPRRTVTCHGGRRGGIDRPRPREVALCLVHGGVGSRIDDDGGADRIQLGTDRCGVGQVEAAAVHRNDLTQRLQAAQQFPADLAGHTRNEDFHARR